jgi:hypothetical protein
MFPAKAGTSYWLKGIRLRRMLPVPMTCREAAMLALAQGRAKRIDLMEDDGYLAYRIQVWFTHTDGEEYCYESKPFSGKGYQGLAHEAAKRVERLGIPRQHVATWIRNHFEKEKIDFTKLFGGNA